MSVTTKALRSYGLSPRFREVLEIPSKATVEFSLIGQGEYNMNYQFIHPVTKEKLVLRLNTGSQMHLQDQIGYEYYALQLLECSGRTPRPRYLDSSKEQLDYGVLVMDFLPGRPLDYGTDLHLAAECLAQIHQVPVPNECGLILPKDPLGAMLEECQQMAQIYMREPRANEQVKKMLCRLLEAAERLIPQKTVGTRCIINTELNSGNFLINGPECPNYLIDWEKPLIGEAAQDLGHFLAPTTTLWKTDVVLTQEEKESFLRKYISAYPLGVDWEVLKEQTALYETITCLRGLSWCAMAWVEYQNPHRPIQNETTYGKIQEYLSEEFLQWIFTTYFFDGMRRLGVEDFFNHTCAQ